MDGYPFYEPFSGRRFDCLGFHVFLRSDEYDHAPIGYAESGGVDGLLLADDIVFERRDLVDDALDVGFRDAVRTHGVGEMAGDV